MNEPGNQPNICAEAVPKRTHKPNQIKRDIRAHQRLMETDGMAWPSELFVLAARKLNSLKMRGQSMPASVEEAGNKDIEAFDIAHAAFIASKGA